MYTESAFVGDHVKEKEGPQDVFGTEEQVVAKEKPSSSLCMTMRREVEQVTYHGSCNWGGRNFCYSCVVVTRGTWLVGCYSSHQGLGLGLVLFRRW